MFGILIASYSNQHMVSNLWALMNTCASPGYHSHVWVSTKHMTRVRQRRQNAGRKQLASGNRMPYNLLMNRPAAQSNKTTDQSNVPPGIRHPQALYYGGTELYQI